MPLAVVHRHASPGVVGRHALAGEEGIVAATVKVQPVDALLAAANLGGDGLPGTAGRGLYPTRERDFVADVEFHIIRAVNIVVTVEVN